MIYWFLLILGCQACTKSLITYVANIDSCYVSFIIILRSYVCRILGLYQVITYVCRLYWFLMSTFFSILNPYVCRIRHIIPKWNSTLFEILNIAWLQCKTISHTMSPWKHSIKQQTVPVWNIYNFNNVFFFILEFSDK